MSDHSDSTLEVTCLVCGEVKRDEYEVLEAHQRLQLHCDACHAPFDLWIDECQFCGEELVVVLPATSTTDDKSSCSAPVAATCPRCHQHQVFDEANTEPVSAVA